MSIRVVVADDHPIFREGLVRSLEEDAAFRVVGAGGSADEAVALVERHAPDLALLDISMPGGGIEAARRIRAAAPDTRIAMLTVSEDEQAVAGALRAGAIGYVLKGVSAAELREILEGVVRGEAHVSAPLAARLLGDLEASRRRQPRHPVDALTKREEDILRRVARGMSNREVAEALSIQEKTVKHYMTSILGKLQARLSFVKPVTARRNRCVCDGEVFADTFVVRSCRELRFGAVLELESELRLERAGFHGAIDITDVVTRADLEAGGTKP